MYFVALSLGSVEEDHFTMTFTIFDIFNWTVIYLQHFVIAKIVIKDKALNLKEVVYIIAASLFLTALVVIGVTALNIGGLISTVTVPLLCMVYFNKIKSYSFSKTCSLTLISILIVALTDILVMIGINSFSPYFLPRIPNFPLPMGLSLNHSLQLAVFILLAYMLSALSAFLLVKVTEKHRSLVNQSQKAQMVLAIGSLIGITVGVIFINLWRYLGAEIEFLFWNTISMVIVFVAGLVITGLYAMVLKERMSLNQKDAEQKILQRYTHQVEEQQSIIKRIQHDMGNILFSMEGYIEKDDLTGLKEYFYANVKTSLAVIDKDNSTLSRLANIKIPELKATLAGKLMLAQSAGINTFIDVIDTIDHISVDSIAIVRMLGIILDNAIEELQALGEDGTLAVACYNTGGGVTFVIRNDCRPNTPSLHKLEQSGFSTKGEGRGLGLNILLEITAAYSDNITLQTSVTDGNFIQKIRVGGAG